MLSTSRLADDLSGRVIAPDDPGYDEARTLFYGGFDRRPAAIVRVAGAPDVARAIEIARGNGLELGVRSGGHSPAGHSVPDGGLVIDLADMRGLELDVEGRTAWAEAGLTTGDYTVTAAEHGLATPFGDTGSVGIGGITLSGGVGYLVRKYGLTIDSLLAAEVVTADGGLLTVDADTHPDLFWAIRGGGGNFVVVTRLKLRLHELDAIVGGMLILPATAEVISSFVAEAEAAPEELSAIANVMVAPPMPFVPEEYHGKLIVLATLAYAGPVDDGQPALEPFRALSPLADMVRPMPYPELFPPEEEGFHPVALGHTMFVERIDEDAARTIIDRLNASTALMSATQLRVLGGAAARVPAEATAYAHRNSPIMVNVAAMFARPEERAVHEPWVTGLAADLQQDDRGAYVGFLADEGDERVRTAYPGTTWDRLRAVKATYDPDNVFRMNQNIPPA
jgi:FAD/FMN-containing dehydrogenase